MVFLHNQPPIYTLYSGYLPGISPFKGLQQGSGPPSQGYHRFAYDVGLLQTYQGHWTPKPGGFTLLSFPHSCVCFLPAGKCGIMNYPWIPCDITTQQQQNLFIYCSTNDAHAGCTPPIPRAPEGSKRNHEEDGHLIKYTRWAPRIAISGVIPPTSREKKHVLTLVTR